MNSFTKLLFICVIIFTFLPCNPCSASENDVQYWNIFSVTRKINSAWKINLSDEQKIGENISEPFFHRIDLGVAYKVNNVVSLEAHYKHMHLKVANEWKRVRVPYFNLLVNLQNSYLTLQSRNRMEYMGYTYKAHHWRFRERIKILSGKPFTSLKIKPFGAEEFFYDFNKSKFRENRLYLGVNLPLFSHLRADFYYALQHIKNPDWYFNHIGGTIFSYTLN